ncbi:MAG: hypothetical protein MI673_09110, partial [Thiotrichales bacterium]|nr:hypothetical protein [Thiotrichales bacterium]
MLNNINAELTREAEQLYDDKLAYHNFSHIHYVFTRADEIINRCRKHGVEVDEEVVYIALLFHDAGFIEDHEQLGFDSKEAYSAYLAGQILQKLDYEAGLIDKVKQAIIATHCDERCISNEDRV